MVYDLTRAITSAIEESVPWRKTSGKSRSFWNNDCKEAVKKSKKAYFDHLREDTDESWEQLKRARNRKIVTIRKVK